MKKLQLFIIFITLVVSTAGVLAQSGPPPFLQPINIYPTPSPTPFVKKTGSNIPITPTNSVELDSSNVVTDITSGSVIPGYSGILIETLDGRVIREYNADLTFNPASNVKVATAYAILKSHGPDYRFQTAVYTDGTIDYQNARLEGNLYISGRDPVFQSQNAVMIADALNKLGIREVNGNLVVTGKFTINQSNSPQTSARILLSTLDPAKRSASATRAWLEYLQTSGMAIQGIYSPGVSIFGETYVGIIPENAKLLFVHESIPLKEIVKLMMCYSNNFIAERLGNELGGAYMVASIVQRDIGVSYQEFYLQTSSGLGINRATPRAMMKLLRVFLKELESYGMTLADVMPVAGIDPGTLQNRFNDIYSIGSLVGKTGTLGNTDGGVSSLSGEMQTRNGGKLLFVIFNQRGSVHRFRNFQDSYIKQIQNEFGGPVTFAYSPMNSQKLAQSRIIFSNTVKN
ncbi:MAG: hypothetical protein D6687_07230 [Acidobacteria bacterium]|jgi:D-alanyl-D-alanine carboxypeptidase/D-alanyl-D-alanine-endopeptidase (penicillin-binding protein 4)|nr:MAG: hypothetical protein D6687_07230 [Acidobacteriota bacterium]GIU81700.1 MAG: carboxypeptidase [Pyrinomonadaceae bacterium]